MESSSSPLRRVMLATAVHQLEAIRYPKLASYKIDGIRAVNATCNLLSRSMKPIPNLHTRKLFGRPEYQGLDGELVVGNPNDPNLMQQTSSGVMSIGGTPEVKWYIFDKWDEPAPYYQRGKKATAVVGSSPESNIIWVRQTLINNVDELRSYEESAVNEGYEGIMLRCPHSPYKQNRSTLREEYLLKVKRFEDSEAIVLDVKELMRNDNEATKDERGFTKRSSHAENKRAAGVLGALIVRDIRTNQEFDVGTGFTFEQRKNLWDGRKYLPGKIVKYKHFPVGVVDSPRFPIFIGFRDQRDM